MISNRKNEAALGKSHVGVKKQESSLKNVLIYLNKKKFFYILLLPGILYFLIFHYIPMYGVIISFKDFSFAKGIFGSNWVGLDNFKQVFKLGDFYKTFANSLVLSSLRIVFGFPVPIILALMLNEVRNKAFKRATQTLIYLPHFISWVVIGGILVNFLSPTWGVVNVVIKSMGFEPIFFMAKPQYFRGTIVLSTIWKEAGWGTILYLAAISGINPELYEAAIVDGANKLKLLRHITLPCISSTIVILLVLNIGHIMSNGFEQVMVFQNTQNLGVSEVFETFTYRYGLLQGRYSFATAVGLFTSFVGMIFLFTSNKIAKMLGEESIL